MTARTRRRSRTTGSRPTRCSAWRRAPFQWFFFHMIEMTPAKTFTHHREQANRIICLARCGLYADAQTFLVLHLPSGMHQETCTYRTRMGVLLGVGARQNDAIICTTPWHVLLLISPCSCAHPADPFRHTS